MPRIKKTALELLIQVGIFVLALTILLKGSDWFIDSAESIGLNMGIPPFIIGVTIVAFGTSLPELATSISSVFQGEPEIPMGNVVGSNITNIALVIGLVAIYVKKVDITYDIWKIDVPYLVFSSIALLAAAYDGKFTLLEGILFFVALLVFLALTFSKQNDEEENDDLEKTTGKTYLLLFLGGIMVWLGAEYTISSVSVIAIALGIPSAVMALIFIALGTSLPEVIVSLNAAKKGKTSIAIGNVMGSNIFNTFCVMSIPRFFGELKVPECVMYFQLPFMVFITIMFVVVTWNKKITLWEGILMLLFYIGFVAFTFYDA